MRLTLRRLGRDERRFGAALAVAPEQLEFTGTVSDALAWPGGSRYPHGIWCDGSLVGFFMVDTDFAGEFDFCDAEAIGIRTFLIDWRRQGQGLGKAAVLSLKPFLKDAYPQATSVWLTVNCRNRGAYRCYELGGFSDTGKLYEGGSAGPQHVMWMDLGIR